MVINFGAAGSYGTEHAPAVGEVVLVDTVGRFDVDDNVHWVPPRRLATVDLALDLGLPTVTCITGSRYSTPRDRASEHFPDGHVEDMELYALAVLLETLGIPLLSLKYVTNLVDGGGREQFRDNVEANRDRAYRALEGLLQT